MTLSEILQAGLAGGAALLGLWCFVLARRLRRLNDLETGLGGAIAVLAAEVARLESAIATARREAIVATEQLGAEVQSARKERALWQLQASGIGADPAAPPRPAGARLRRRARGEEEAAHA